MDPETQYRQYQSPPNRYRREPVPSHLQCSRRRTQKDRTNRTIQVFGDWYSVALRYPSVRACCEVVSLRIRKTACTALHKAVVFALANLLAVWFSRLSVQCFKAQDIRHWGGGDFFADLRIFPSQYKVFLNYVVIHSIVCARMMVTEEKNEASMRNFVILASWALRVESSCKILLACMNLKRLLFFSVLADCQFIRGFKLLILASFWRTVRVTYCSRWCLSCVRKHVSSSKNTTRSVDRVKCSL
jgi:hypothetical protein